MRVLRRRDKECGMKRLRTIVLMLLRGEEDLHGESCFEFVMVVTS